MPSTLPPLQAQAFAATLRDATTPVLIDFSADWCSSCRALEPVLEQISQDRDDVAIYRVDVDAEETLAAEHGVRSIPTLLLYSGDKVIDTLVGPHPRSTIEASLDKAVS